MDPQHVPHQAFAAGWHAALATTLSLDGDAFQLVHGQPALLAQQAGSLPELADAMPGNMAVVGLDADTPRFSENYMDLLDALRDGQQEELRRLLGDPLFAQWRSFRRARTSPGGMGPEDMFRHWAARHLSPDQAPRADTLFRRRARTSLDGAWEALTLQSNFMRVEARDGSSWRTLPRYLFQPDSIEKALQESRPARIDVDVHPLTSVLGARWARRLPVALAAPFALGARAEDEPAVAEGDRVQVRGTIGQAAVIDVQPGHWFSHRVVHEAFSARADASRWEAVGEPPWTAFFGPTGTLAHRVRKLVIVSDAEMTVTRHGRFARAARQGDGSLASHGDWPLFGPPVARSGEAPQRLNDDGSLSTVHRLPRGAMQLLGVVVQSTPF